MCIMCPKHTHTHHRHTIPTMFRSGQRSDLMMAQTWPMKLWKEEALSARQTFFEERQEQQKIVFFLKRVRERKRHG
jgi:hypothetical protein